MPSQQRSKRPGRPSSRSARSRPARAAARSAARPALERARGLVRHAPWLTTAPRRGPDLGPRKQYARADRPRRTTIEVVLVASNKPARPGLDCGAGARPPDLDARTARRIARGQFDRAAERGAARIIASARSRSPASCASCRREFVAAMGGADRQHPPFAAAQISRSRHACAGARGRRERRPAASVHLVTEEVDAGAILGQAEVAIAARRRRAIARQRGC